MAGQSGIPQLYVLDMVAEAQKFNSLFWHYDLSEAEAKACC
jgi:hypothetical protein